MLLETLDNERNGIIIYSKNVLSEENNFRIIYKADPQHQPKPLKFGDVCRYLAEDTPKNLILYRLLTNLNELEIVRSHLGVLIYVNGEKELLYFDPVYAVKELEDYLTEMEKGMIRFRIQQVGLTYSGKLKGGINFDEVYKIDLEAKEAKYQNDKMFAEALYSREPEVKKIKKEIRLKPGENIKSSFKEDRSNVKAGSKIKIKKETKGDEPEEMITEVKEAEEMNKQQFHSLFKSLINTGKEEKEVVLKIDNK